MALYLVRAVYKPEAVVALSKSPQNRIDTIRRIVEHLGGVVESGGMAFGGVTSELVAICDMPDQVSAAALAIGVSAGGSVEQITTTPLITGEQGLDALKKAANAGYRPPGL